METRVAVYARVSSEAQRKERTIESQLREVPAFCVARGWTIVETYVDDGKSAATGKRRDTFERLLADTEAGRFDVVAVIAQDRVTRTMSWRERGAILGTLQESNVLLAIATTGQVLDLRTDAGSLLAGIGAHQAGSANAQRVADTMRGKRELVERGGKPQGSTPIGLLYDRDREVWALDPVWSVAIREIHERVARGEPTGSIARDLHARGLKRPRGGAWTDSRVREIVTCETYTGRLAVGRGRTVAVPPIVDLDLATEARAVLGDRDAPPPPRTRHPHLLVGLMRCGLCRAKVGIHGYGTADGQVHAYVCTSRRFARFTGRSCDLPWVMVADLDAQWWPAVTDALASDAVIDQACGGATPGAQDADAVGRATAELARIDRLTTDLHAHAAEGLISPEVADAQVRRLGTARRAAAQALRSAQATNAGIRPAMDRAALVERVGLLRRWCEQADAYRRQTMMRALLEGAVLRPGSMSANLRIPVDTVQVDASSRISVARSVPAGRLTIAIPRHRAA